MALVVSAIVVVIVERPRSVVPVMAFVRAFAVLMVLVSAVAAIQGILLVAFAFARAAIAVAAERNPRAKRNDQSNVGKKSPDFTRKGADQVKKAVNSTHIYILFLRFIAAFSSKMAEKPPSFITKRQRRRPNGHWISTLPFPKITNYLTLSIGERAKNRKNFALFAQWETKKPPHPHGQDGSQV